MYIPPMIIPKKEGCCDEQKPNLPCCENVMGIYPSARRHRRRRRPCSPRHRLPWMPPIPPGGPPGQVVEVPFPVPNVTYLDPIRVPDMVLPPMPPPPPRRPRSLMYNGQMPMPPMMPHPHMMPPPWMRRRQCNIVRECDVGTIRNNCNCGNC